MDFILIGYAIALCIALVFSVALLLSLFIQPKGVLNKLDAKGDDSRGEVQVRLVPFGFSDPPYYCIEYKTGIIWNKLQEADTFLEYPSYTTKISSDLKNFTKFAKNFKDPQYLQRYKIEQENIFREHQKNFEERKKSRKVYNL